MVVIRKAVSEADLRTLASMSAKLFSRHGPFSSWSAQWWATVVLGIQSAKMDTSTQPAITSATLTHVVDVLDQSTDTLDPVVSSWLDSMPASALQDLLAQENSALICTFLLSLAAQRRLQTVPVLHKLVYPAWKHAATTAIVASGRLSGSHLRSVDATVVVAQQLLLTTPPNHQLPPVDLRQALIIQTARTKVFDSNNIRDLIRHLPYLVILQTVQGVSDKMRRQIAHLLQTLAMASNFKAAVFRHLELLKSVFLSNEWSQPSFDHSIEAGMVDALKLIMSDGSSGESRALRVVHVLIMP